jgi:hypothetical protein
MIPLLCTYYEAHLVLYPMRPPVMDVTYSPIAWHSGFGFLEVSVQLVLYQNHSIQQLLHDGILVLIVRLRDLSKLVLRLPIDVRLSN